VTAISTGAKAAVAGDEGGEEGGEGGGEERSFQCETCRSVVSAVLAKRKDAARLCSEVAENAAERAACTGFVATNGKTVEDALSDVSVCSRMGHCGGRYERYMARKSDSKWVPGSFPYHYMGSPGEGTVDAVKRISASIGCADGSREGFVDTTKFTNIAACAARWSHSLSMCPPGNAGSGNGKYGCSACAPGWHLCGWKPVAGLAQSTCASNGAMPGADSAEVSRHVCYDECKGQPGMFASAASFASSADHQCNTASGVMMTTGCGTLTTGAGGDTRTDCSGFAKLKDKSCKDNAQCVGSGFRACDKNAAIGSPGQWRGVMCCRDNVSTSNRQCAA
jgi:hypothetical protein